MDKKLFLKSFRNTTCAAIYIFLVSQLMQSGDKIFGKSANSAIGGLVVLLLFSLSAAVVGGLIFGESVIQLIDNKKRNAIMSAIYSVGWLGFYTIIGILVLIII